MSEKNAQSYRNELEALLRRAEDEGYRFNVEYEYDDRDIDLEYFFIAVDDYTDHATVNSDLVWETRI